MPHVDFTFRIGDLLNAAVLASIGWMMRRTYRGIRHFFDNVTIMEKRIESTATMVDEHSEIIIRARLHPGPLKRVSKKRRITDHLVAD